MRSALGLLSWNHLAELGVQACVSLNTILKAACAISK
jgi:hypothetical protein